MAKTHPFFLCLLPFLLWSGAAGAATAAFNPQVASAYTQALKLKINSSSQDFKSEVTKQNAAALLVANYQDFLVLAVQQDPAVYDKLIAAQEGRLKKLQSLKERSVWVNYGIAEIRMHLAISKLLFDNKLAAAWEFRKAYLQYEANAAQYPDFIPNRKLLGVMQVLIGSVPDQYKWCFNIIGMKGSVTAGLKNLYLAASNPNPFQQEAKILHVLMQQLVDPEKSDAAEKLAIELSRNDSDNLLNTFIAMHLLKKLKKSDAALQVYLNRPAGSGYMAFPYLHHMAGDLYLYKGNFQRSVQENKIFMEQHRGMHHQKAAHFKLYLAHWLNRNNAMAKVHLKQIAETGKAVVEEDIYASRFLERNEKLNRPLLLARLQSDGGYYQEALQVLQQMVLTPDSAQDVRLEYMYRKGRVYHGLEQLAQAKRFYEQTMALSQQSTLYFGPNAALQLGYIYQEENNVAKARFYYEKAMQYKGHPYKNSIDSKAKLALAAL